MKKKIVALMIMIFVIMSCTVFAFDTSIVKPTPTEPEGVGAISSNILGVIKWAGYAIALGMVLYIGIKYMMAAANEKASLKQTVINYLIGAVVLFAAVTIFNAVVTFFGGDFTATEAEIPTTQEGITKPGAGGGGSKRGEMVDMLQ